MCGAPRPGGKAHERVCGRVRARRDRDALRHLRGRDDSGRRFTPLMSPVRVAPPRSATRASRWRRRTEGRTVLTHLRKGTQIDDRVYGTEASSSQTCHRPGQHGTHGGHGRRTASRAETRDVHRPATTRYQGSTQTSQLEDIPDYYRRDEPPRLPNQDTHSYPAISCTALCILPVQRRLPL